LLLLLLQAIFKYASQLPPSKGPARLQRLLEALLGSSSSSALAAAGECLWMLFEGIVSS
jgi:hypothetical protein